MKRLWGLALAGTLLVSIAADLVLLRGVDRGEFWWSEIPGFFAVFGFVSCWAIVVVSKALGHYWLQKTEDYYGPGDADD